jgi:glycosyltransferase involved in cell wall biosynthesis
MRFVFASYVYTEEYNHPEEWLRHIRFYGGILESLSKKNDVISIEQIDYEGQYLQGGVDYRFKRFPKSSLYVPIELHRFIKGCKPDVVFIQGLHFPLQVIQLRMMLGRKVKIMVQNHAEKPFTGFKKYLQKIADRAIDAYLFASREMGLDWVKKGNLSSPKKIHEVMEISSVFYPIEKELAKAQTKVTGRRVFLWVGRLNKNKDPLTVVSAFLQFVHSEPSARLYMIYHTGELLQQIKDLLAYSVNKDSVVLVGKVPNDDLLYWYNSADFIVSGSHYEGSGTAVCEAMSCGCVPIVTDIFSFRMIADHGNCGILYKPGSAAITLSAFMQTKSLDIREKRENCLKYFSNHLSFEAIAKRISEIAASLQ